MELFSLNNILCFLAGTAFGGVAYHISVKIKSSSYKSTQEYVITQGDVAGRDIHKNK